MCITSREIFRKLSPSKLKYPYYPIFNFGGHFFDGLNQNVMHTVKNIFKIFFFKLVQKLVFFRYLSEVHFRSPPIKLWFMLISSITPMSIPVHIALHVLFLMYQRKIVFIPKRRIL